MRIYTVVALLIVVILTLDALGECEGWFGRGSRSRSSSSSKSRSSPVVRSTSRSSRRSSSSSRRDSGRFWGGRSRSHRSSSRSTSRTSRTRSTSRTNSRRTSSTRRAGRWWGRCTRTSSRSSLSKTRKVSVKKTERGTTIQAGKTTVHVNNYGKIRDRDETGHRTGLGTIARKLVSQPGKTIKAVKSFVKSYNDMKNKNIVGGNLPAHRQANKDATIKADAETAAAISALREQYKNIRISNNYHKKDRVIHIGDTRTKEERDNTMNANRKGREDAKRARGSN